MAQRFPTLGVIVEDGQVSKGTFGKGAKLGPLSRAHAELGDPTRHRRVAAAGLATVATGGLLGLAPLLTKKAKSIAFVVFPSGQVHERKLDGNIQIRAAQSEVVRFNAIAAAAG